MDIDHRRVVAKIGDESADLVDVAIDTARAVAMRDKIGAVRSNMRPQGRMLAMGRYSCATPLLKPA